MQGLSDETVIAVWERGRRASAPTQARLLTTLACPDLDSAAIDALPIGRRDAALLNLREMTYGDTAMCFLACPACDEGLEHTVRLADIRVVAPEEGEGPWTWRGGPWEVCFRLPTVADFEWVAKADAHDVRRQLVQRLVVRASRANDHIESGGVPDDVVAELEREIERLDPQADIRFGQACPTCQHRFEAPFDIAAFLWHEIDVDARRLLQAIDVIARSYGWSETEILRLGRSRRRTYLELCGAR